MYDVRCTSQRGSRLEREEALMEIRQRPDAGTRPGPETSPAGAVTMRVVGATAIALAASMAIQNAMFVVDRTSRLRGPDRGGARLARGEPGRGRDRGRPGGAAPAAAARVRDRSPRARRASRGCGRGLVAPRGGRGRDSLGGLRALRRSVDRSRAVRRRARRAEPGVRARLAAACSSVRAGAAGARHHLHRRCPRRARERPDSGLAAPAGPGGREPAARRRGGNLAIADGSALLFVGLPGFFAWLVWLLATGVRLVRARTPAVPAGPATTDLRQVVTRSGTLPSR